MNRQEYWDWRLDLARKNPKLQFYVLDANHRPVPVDDIKEWAQFFEDDEARRVALTSINGLRVSTVFLGLDHGWNSNRRPILFETMIFPDKHPTPEIDLERIKDWAHAYQTRYASWDEAIAGHQVVVTIIGEGLL